MKPKIKESRVERKGNKAIIGNGEEHDIQIEILEDGALSMSGVDRDNSIYFYPEQVKHLKKVLKELKYVAVQEKKKTS